MVESDQNLGNQLREKYIGTLAAERALTGLVSYLISSGRIDWLHDVQPWVARSGREQVVSLYKIGRRIGLSREQTSEAVRDEIGNIYRQLQQVGNERWEKERSENYIMGNLSEGEQS